MRTSNSSRHFPEPITTHDRGFSATWTGIPVSCLSLRSIPFSNAPPPVRMIPLSMTSAASSGGHRSRVFFTASMIELTGSSRARRISSDVTWMVLGRPLTRSRPLISAIMSSGVGKADPMAILMASEVRSPRATEYSFLTCWMMASSSSSPPTRTLEAQTIPPSEITATSVVPPPMSTTMFPDGSWMRSPAPMAAAMGSSMMKAARAPAEMVASSTARCSTPVMPEGTHTTTRGLAMNRRWCTFWMK